ncbi:MAG TPA: Rieske 2Fe-2S domain-containing protein [Candidatus Dormibacteraeota bacterium]
MSLRITFLGHAGLWLETRGGTILCDPFFNPAYFHSWYPFPSNENIDLKSISKPDYLYISHLHADHFDRKLLAEVIDKDTTVLLPDYPIDLMEKAYRELGFNKFVKTRNGVPAQLARGLSVAIVAMVAPTDGPLGDSGLIVDDGEVRVFDQNDSRPIDLEALAALGPFDAHFVQFSGAIWYPFVYQYPDEMLEALGRKKRANEMARALRYVREVDAKWVFPSAGPPCFLDDGLFAYNDFNRHPANTFPDQSVFLEYLQENEVAGGRLVVPGSTVTLKGDDCDVVHPGDEEEVWRPFRHKLMYLQDYKTRHQAEIDAAKASWPRHQVDVVGALQEWFEPLMEKADITCAGIGSTVVLDLGDEGVAIDFMRRVVEPWDGVAEWGYYFRFDRGIVESCILDHTEDWVNSAFLSCRFQANRVGAFNEYVYNFFKCLSMERLQYAEGYYAEKAPITQFWETDGYRIQRRCPHLKSDLTKFASIEDGVLTCSLHGWQFDLETGRCLTSDDHWIYSRRLAADGSVIERPDPVVAEHGATIRDECGACRYVPERFPKRRAKGLAGAAESVVETVETVVEKVAEVVKPPDEPVAS